MNKVCLALLGAVVMSCRDKPGLDGGSDDVDAGATRIDAGEVLADGGSLAVGGCVSPDEQKFMVRLQHRADNGLFTCALVSFRKDAGPHATYQMTPPAGFQIDEARYSNTCDMEQSDGRLTHENSGAVGQVWGEVQFGVVFRGRPVSFFIDGGVILGTRIFEFDTQYADSNSRCAAN